MLHYPQIDPVIFRVGPFAVRWYGLMYVLGFTATFLLVGRQIRRFRLDWLKDQVENLNLAIILGVVLGGRLGYVFFYNPSHYLSHPAEILNTMQGGMSFHGGLLGTIAAGFLFCRWKKLPFLYCADLYVVTVPIGLGLGRLGNFINGELFGRVSDVPWAMVFPDGGPLPRHPSQLYQAFLEGVLLFLFLWRMKEKRWPAGSMLGLFLIGYGVVRILVEFFREPDIQLGFLFSFVTMGQLLSSLMVATGAAIIAFAFRRAAGEKQHTVPREGGARSALPKKSRRTDNP